MLYSALLYRWFSINIFDYSEIPDFLLAAFKNPGAFLLVGIQALGLMGIYVLAWIGMKIWIKRRYGFESAIPALHPFVVANILLVTALGTIAFTYFSTTTTASSIKSGEKTNGGGTVQDVLRLRRSGYCARTTVHRSYPKGRFLL
jgi:hypothetical protein